MKKILILFGILLIVVPLDFLGFPYWIENAFYIFTGCILLFIAYFNRRVSVPRQKADSFEENTPSLSPPPSPSPLPSSPDGMITKEE